MQGKSHIKRQTRESDSHFLQLCTFTPTFHPLLPLPLPRLPSFPSLLAPLHPISTLLFAFFTPFPSCYFPCSSYLLILLSLFFLLILTSSACTSSLSPIHHLYTFSIYFISFIYTCTPFPISLYILSSLPSVCLLSTYSYLTLLSPHYQLLAVSFPLLLPSLSVVSPPACYPDPLDASQNTAGVQFLLFSPYLPIPLLASLPYSNSPPCLVFSICTLFWLPTH